MKEYKAQGTPLLINCLTLPLFHRLVEQLSQITLHHVGMNTDNHKEYFKENSTTYFNILEEQGFSVGVFCLGKGSTLNYHDHPNMLVLSKFLRGKIHHRALDLLDRSYQVTLPQMLFQEDSTDVVGTKLEAVVRSERIFEGGEMNYLTPEKGNIHRFTALEDTAILDILLPNYNETTSYCNYYMEMSIEEQNAEITQNGADMGVDQAQDWQQEQRSLKPVYKPKAAKKPTYRKPGEKTILVYTLPPLEQEINLVPYQGEKFEFQYEDIESDDNM